MKQFNISLWLKDKSRKVVTRDGRPVRIVCWDSPNKTFPIVGFIDNKPTVFVWDNYGYSHAGHLESKQDLFFADEEEELTEFEKKMLDSIIDCLDGLCFIDSDQLNWLKSLKPRWKPTEEQMEALKCSYKSYIIDGKERRTLESLYNDLKKL